MEPNTIDRQLDRGGAVMIRSACVVFACLGALSSIVYAEEGNLLGSTSLSAEGIVEVLTTRVYDPETGKGRVETRTTYVDGRIERSVEDFAPEAGSPQSEWRNLGSTESTTYFPDSGTTVREQNAIVSETIRETYDEATQRWSSQIDTEYASGLTLSSVTETNNRQGHEDATSSSALLPVLEAPLLETTEAGFERFSSMLDGVEIVFDPGQEVSRPGAMELRKFVDLSPPKVLEVTRGAMTLPAPDGNEGTVLRVVYQSRWKEKTAAGESLPEDWQTVNDLFRVARMTGGPGGDLQLVRALPFRLSIVGHGETVSSKGLAMAVIQDATPNIERLLILEFVTESYRYEAFQEEVPPLTDGDAERVSNLSGLLPPGGDPDACCVPWTNVQRGLFPKLRAGPQGHASGEHTSRVDFDLTCTCSSTCQNSTEVSASRLAYCEDVGNVGLLTQHRMQSNWAGNPSFGYMSTDASTAGYFCGQNTCLEPFGCLLPFSVTVTPTGTGLSFNASPQPHWDMRHAVSLGCPPCQPANPI